MKRPIYQLFLFISVAVLADSSPAFSQERRPTGKRIRTENDSQFYRRNLGIDSLKALQVSQIQSEYKLGIGALMRDSSVTEDGRRAKVRALMETKNAKLRKILDPSQQNRIIPATEWSVRPEEEKGKRVIKP